MSRCCINRAPDAECILINICLSSPTSSFPLSEEDSLLCLPRSFSCFYPLFLLLSLPFPRPLSSLSLPPPPSVSLPSPITHPSTPPHLLPSFLPFPSGGCLPVTYRGFNLHFLVSELERVSHSEIPFCETPFRKIVLPTCFLYICSSL